jgi:hypothetical protein
MVWYRLSRGSGMTKPKERPWTLSVPAAGGRYYGIGRNAAYRAAERGEIPTVQVGRLLRVPIAILEKKLTEGASESR